MAKIDLDSTTGKILHNDVEKLDLTTFNQTGSLLYKSDIPDAANLDTYVVAGLYHQDSSVFAANGTNYPSPNAGMLTVKAKGSMIYQEYHSFQSDEDIWFRAKFNTTWNAWRKLSLPIASTAEARAGLDNTKAITSLRLREGLNATGEAPIYACRAWVNFNGTGTVAIRASGNVSSITDVSTGRYEANLILPMNTENTYAVSSSCNNNNSSPSEFANFVHGAWAFPYTSTKVRIKTGNTNTTTDLDLSCINIAIVQ